MYLISKLEYLNEFDKHSKVFKLKDKDCGLLGFVAIHRQKIGFSALGATRLWLYKNQEDALKDSLRLSKLMSYKSALAGLPYTGGKAVLIENKISRQDRQKLFKKYAVLLNNLKGNFITGTDVGVSNQDIKLMMKYTKYVIGQNLNPAYYTAFGVFQALQLCLYHYLGDSDFAGHSIAIQGVGKTGSNLLKLISGKDLKIYVSDVNTDALRKIKILFPEVKIIQPEEIYSLETDFFCPCALGGVLTEAVVEKLRCKIICGSANNQLACGSVAELLKQKGIIYVPDYIVNSGGLISVVDEFENQVHNDERIMRKILLVRDRLEQIMQKSKQNDTPMVSIADFLAQKIVNQEIVNRV